MNATLVNSSRTAIRAVDKPLPAPSVTLEAALIGIESARLALKCSEEQLMAWILAGDLEWAFDLRGKNNSRAYIRVLTRSVVKLQQPRTPVSLRRRDWAAWMSAAPSFDAVFESVFRHHRPWMRTSELVQVWNCCSGHIRNLIDLKFLEIAEKHYMPNEARLVSRQSVADFMRQRRIH